MSKSNDLVNEDINIKEGDKPFSFSFFNSEEKKYELDEILGKENIVIYFYPKDFTPGCTLCKPKKNSLKIIKSLKKTK